MGTRKRQNALFPLGFASIGHPRMDPKMDPKMNPMLFMRTTGEKNAIVKSNL